MEGKVMKQFFVFFLMLLLFPLSGKCGMKESLNPTKLWELRDSLQSCITTHTIEDDAQALFSEIPRLNAQLSRVVAIIPTPRLQIDVVEASCPASASHIDAIQQRLQKEEFQRIASNCPGIRTITSYVDAHPQCQIISVTDEALEAFIVAHAKSVDARTAYIVRLARMVQCEVALVNMGFSLREHRNRYGNQNVTVRGLLIVDFYFEKDHLKTILRLVRAETNID